MKLNTTLGTIVLYLAASASFAVTSDTESIPPEQGFENQVKRAVRGKDFMIVAAHPLATQAGYDVLSRGGTAVDAAIATQMVLNLVEPQSSGIGGGAFLVYWDNDKKRLHTLDGRETAPAGIEADRFLDDSGNPLPWWQRITGGGSVGVPGTLKLLEVAHQRFGKEPWDALFKPAIALAREGFIVSPRMANSIAAAADKGLKNFEETSRYFFDENGSPIREGTIVKNAAFAETLDIIAQNGSSPFYQGGIARDIVEIVNSSRPESLSLEDLRAYRVIERPPVCAPYRQYQVCGMGPPTSGTLTVGQILGMISHGPIPDTALDPSFVHRMLEAQKLAYADRGLYIADSDYIPVPVSGLLDAGYLNERAGLIDETAAMASAEPGSPPTLGTRISYAPDTDLELPGTSHISIVDRSGNIVSMTTTIESGFGSRLMTRGFLLNNELTDFSAHPQREGIPIANRIQPGKRPRSSMAPTIVFDSTREPVLVAGSPGGSRIINYVAKTIVAVLDFDIDAQSAVALPHFSNRNGATELEIGTPVDDLSKALHGLGHEVKSLDMNSGLHIIRRLNDGTLEGGADPRREGVALGD